MEKVKRMADGKVVLEGVIYDTSITKRINVTNQNTGNKISSIYNLIRSKMIFF